MNLFDDPRIVMTLDAGGTNFVFSAICSGENVVEPFHLPSNGGNLPKSLGNILDGFEHVMGQLKKKPDAISFAFPGPADYPNGIIGDLVNLPAYQGGVALGPILKEKFKLPVFINNDGDLFAYGEAIAGFLPEINSKLKEAGSPKKYKNLLGVTLGTGFGGGIVHDGKLFIGDNAMAAEVYAFRNKLAPAMFAEDGISIRGVQNNYQNLSRDPMAANYTPKDIYQIASGEKEGDQKAAYQSFAIMGEILGDVLAQLATTLDCLIVIGGGLSGASKLYMPAVLKEMNSAYQLSDGQFIPRLIQKVVNLDSTEGIDTITHQKTVQLNVSDTIQVAYSPEAYIGVGTSRMGANRAISLGAVAYALSVLDS